MHTPCSAAKSGTTNEENFLIDNYLKFNNKRGGYVRCDTGSPYTTTNYTHDFVLLSKEDTHSTAEVLRGKVTFFFELHSRVYFYTVDKKLF